MESLADAPPQLEVFSRPGCHLCEQLVEELLPMVRGRLPVRVHDIETRSDWLQAYGTLIPVVRFEGQEVCHYKLDRAAIQHILATHMSSNQAS